MHYIHQYINDIGIIMVTCKNFISFNLEKNNRVEYQNKVGQHIKTVEICYNNIDKPWLYNVFTCNNK